MAERLRAARPAVYLSEAGDGTLDLPMGGDPLLPADAPYPYANFVAAVDCAAIPPGGRRPAAARRASAVVRRPGCGAPRDRLRRGAPGPGRHPLVRRRPAGEDEEPAYEPYEER
ncbi:hypothetical protein [Streptomyces poonensis]|uniref:hypothetical protein n=1 Tax=Streptomyces poonensis TaxID=68255 RepID=UPI001679D89C|nr:hypothetical protein [Streptomyces poonensis]